MKLIYIAGPYTADTQDGILENIRRAEAAGKEVLLKGHIPVIPHKITSLWDFDHANFREWQHKDWLNKFCIPLLSRCDAILLIPGWAQSKGTLMEYGHAIEQKMKIYMGIEELGLRDTI